MAMVAKGAQVNAVGLAFFIITTEISSLTSSIPHCYLTSLHKESVHVRSIAYAQAFSAFASQG
jgi:hypothetical protein